MKAKPIEIKWHPGLSIFACESFLKAVGDEYGWLGGVDESDKLRCILPFTIVRKGIFKMPRFRTETIFVEEELALEEETSFLNSVIEYFRSIKTDIIIPASNNAIFRTYPDGADAAPYGSYVIDLSKSEEVLWRNINRIQRQNINKAKKKGISISIGTQRLDEAYRLIRDTFKRSKLPFMSFESLKRYVHGLGEHGKLMIADYQGHIQSCVVYAFSDYCAYAVYGGNHARQFPGANKLLHWEAIRLFRKLGVKRYDFYGARINPEKGSKQEAINSFKRRLGGKLIEGYIWKYPLSPLRSKAYTYAVRFLRGGDIVDAERHKMKKA